MALAEVLAHIDSEISRLQQAKALLTESGAVTAGKTGRGRPKGSKNVAAAPAAPASAKSKRTLTPEGRKAIADAMKRRWAERREQTAE